MKEAKNKKRKKKLIIFGSIFVFALVFFVAAVEFTSHSGFCASCHYKKPFFNRWETSSHSEFECSGQRYAMRAA